MIFPDSKLPKYAWLAASLLFSICGTPPFFAAGLRSSSPKFEDAGTFILLLAGRQIGTEKFQIRPSGGGIKACAEIQFKVSQDGKGLEFKTYPDLILNSQLQPVAYTWNQQGAKSSQIQINFRESPATVRYHTIHGQQDDREFNLARDVVILDDNVIDQYELLAWRYSMTAGGKQTFAAFIPQEALPGTIEVS
ncbi:MAG TPA: hypothetical protein VFZ08_15720, partial [Terriglobia bacterium]|nr:hypothetical protein [Terriglobia bacterium]